MSYLSKYRYIKPMKIGTIMLFFISFINQPILSIWTLFMCFKGITQRSQSTIISIFIMIQLRSLINSGIAVAYSGISSLIKWATIFALSFMILFIAHDEYKKILNRIYFLFALFSITVIVSGFLFSSYPVVAAFKMIAYIIPFLAILKGICNTNYIDWIKKITIPLGILLIGSIFLLPFPVGYLKNGHAFQGMFNHPNVFGVMLAMFLAGFLYSSSKITIKQICISALVLVLVVLSESRTGILACFCVFMLYLFSKEIWKKSSSKIYFTILLFVIAIVLLTFDDALMTTIYALIYKGGNSSIFFSRANQFKANISRFYLSPIFGTGFNVPYVPNVYSFGFSFDLVVENGNLILALLGDVGIIGFILFSVCYLQLLKIGWGNKIVLFIIPFLVSMGEQSFFSTNNFAIIMYMYISIFVADGLKKYKKNESV